MKKSVPHIAIFGLKGIPARGGTASVGENLVKVLNDKYRFTIYATSSHGSEHYPYENVRQFVFKKILPHKLNVFYYNLMAAFHAVLFENYDLVHTNQIDTGYIVPILRLKYKVVSTHHGKTYEMSKWGKVMKIFFRHTEKLMMKYANKVTFVTESEQDTAHPKYRNKYVTINNGIDPSQPVANLQLEEDYIMFAAGRIIPHKGCHIFLEALKQINYTGKVKIIGDYCQLADYEEQLLGYKKHLDIDFVGMLFEKSELLAYVEKAKLFVFPSYYEAMSMMLLEAASVRTPLICSDIIQNKLVFSDDEVEFFNVGDVNDLAKKISSFLNEPKPFIEKTDKAYLKLVTKYLWKNIGKKYDLLYQEFLKDSYKNSNPVLKVSELNLNSNKQVVEKLKTKVNL